MINREVDRSQIYLTFVLDSVIFLWVNEKRKEC